MGLPVASWKERDSLWERSGVGWWSACHRGEFYGALIVFYFWEGGSVVESEE